MNTTEIVRDWRGTVIEVGDIILYAVKHSTSVEVNQAVVKEIKHETDTTYREGSPYRDKYSLVVDWVDSSYYYRPGVKNTKDHRVVKTYTLTNFSAITVVEKHQNEAWGFPVAPVKWK